MQWRIVSFFVETEDLERDIPHLSTGMNIEYCDTIYCIFGCFSGGKHCHKLTKSEPKVEGLPQKSISHLVKSLARLLLLLASLSKFLRPIRERKAGVREAFISLFP